MIAKKRGEKAEKKSRYKRLEQERRLDEMVEDVSRM